MIYCDGDIIKSWGDLYLGIITHSDERGFYHVRWGSYYYSVDRLEDEDSIGINPLSIRNFPKITDKNFYLDLYDLL